MEGGTGEEDMEKDEETETDIYFAKKKNVRKQECRSVKIVLKINRNTVRSIYIYMNDINIYVKKTYIYENICTYIFIWFPGRKDMRV